MKRVLSILAVVGAILSSAPVTRADTLLGTYAFACVTNNTGYCSSVAPQMTAELWAESLTSTEVVFKIFNDQDYPLFPGHVSTVTEVYFQNSTPISLGAFGGFTDSGIGVNFAAAGIPHNAPGYLGAGFQIFFDAEEDGNGITQGVDQGEWLGLRYVLTGVTAGQVVPLIGSGPDDLKIGLHVQSIDGGTSEGMVTDGVVPEPASMLLLGTGLLGTGLLRRRRNR